MCLKWQISPARTRSTLTCRRPASETSSKLRTHKRARRSARGRASRRRAGGAAGGGRAAERVAGDEPAPQDDEPAPQDDEAAPQQEEDATPFSRGVALAEIGVKKRADEARADGRTEFADTLEATIVTTAEQRARRRSSRGRRRKTSRGRLKE